MQKGSGTVSIESMKVSIFYLCDKFEIGYDMYLSRRQNTILPQTEGRLNVWCNDQWVIEILELGSSIHLFFETYTENRKKHRTL